MWGLGVGGGGRTATNDPYSPSISLNHVQAKFRYVKKLPLSRKSILVILRVRVEILV